MAVLFPTIFPWYLSLFVVQTPSRSVSFIEPSPRAEWWCNGENPASVGMIKGCQLAVIHQLSISIGAALCLSTIFCRSRMASSPTPGLCLSLQLGTNDWKHEHVKNTAWWLSSVICGCHSPWDYHSVFEHFLARLVTMEGTRPARDMWKKPLQWAWWHGDRWWISISWWIRSQTPSPPSCGAWVCQSHAGDAWNGGDAPRCYKKELGFSTHKKKRMKQASCFWKHWIYDVCKTWAIPALSCIAMSG